jgi:hypothetical protein
MLTGSTVCASTRPSTIQRALVSEFELCESSATIARFFGRTPPDGAHKLAPDEWILIGEDAVNALASADPQVIDFSSGLVCLQLSGPGWEEAVSYLSDLDLPAGRPIFVQGIVADVPAKAIVHSDVLSLYVSPTVAHHVRHELSLLQRFDWTAMEVTPERALA